jgi:hypothetical protein
MKHSIQSIPNLTRIAAFLLRNDHITLLRNDHITLLRNDHITTIYYHIKTYKGNIHILMGLLLYEIKILMIDWY